MSINPVLKDGLIKLEMYNTKPTDGLKFVSELKNEENPYIKLHLIDAEKYGATAVYFRHFENRPSIPQIYIYEEQKDINTLHKKLWSSCKVPMFFIFTKTEIKIFNSMSKKNINEEDINPFETIVIASEVQVKLKYFKAKMFDSGEFWNKKYNKNFSHKNSAYNSLLEKLELSVSGFQMETEFILKATRLHVQPHFVDIPTIYNGNPSYIQHVTDTFRFIYLILKEFWT